MTTQKATSRPSFAAVLHRLSLGDEVSGAELLALPGFSVVETDMPMHRCLNYGLIDVPELVVLAGQLAEPEVPGVAAFAALIAGAIRHDEEQFGCLEDLGPDLRSKIWELGCAADRCVSLPR